MKESENIFLVIITLRKIILCVSKTFHGLVLGLVGLIDAKGIDLAQPVWS